MRRMLDPKEVGGSTTLYRHHIKVNAGPNRSFASLELYTKSNTEFTNDSFKSYIQGKKITASGRVLHNQKWYNISFLYGYSGGILCEWYDIESPESDSETFNYPNISDNIFPVE